ncbi:hypothetical protein LCGC14_0015010 [marine sediment metagenome]|uniref:Uncharacterized protein n=1 Tax=marine sediment metagenome TaxID=412755 RepID=A0A0F9W129_9ZZZZ|nr:hypothetical protein [Phycisphaerae bacterium]HDZ43884.1 hypothetical protein [Phycisphaerae bacterium]
MKYRTRLYRSVLAGMMVVLAAGHVAWASPSGLNNIPTTDVVPPNVLVLQTWTNLISREDPEQYIGFKASFLKGLEFGVDWKATDDTHAHATFQAKYAFDILPDWVRGVIGIANVSDNRADQGTVFPYVATSVDLKVFRLHGGYAGQPHNEAFFAGIDRTFLLFDRNLQLKADAIHIDDKEEMLLSVGFLYEFGRQNADEAPLDGVLGVVDAIAKNMILEAWVTFPTTTGAEDIYTVKLNYVFKF